MISQRKLECSGCSVVFGNAPASLPRVRKARLGLGKKAGEVIRVDAAEVDVARPDAPPGRELCEDHPAAVVPLPAQEVAVADVAEERPRRGVLR